MKREYWDIAPDKDEPGTVHLDRYEREITPQTLARIIGEEARRERAYDAVCARAARDSKAPHHFAMTSYAVRPASHAELDRKDEEQKALRFLRGGKG